MDPMADEWENQKCLTWRMLYRFARMLMWVTFNIFFKRIDVVGLDKLQKGKPSILIANHPASFLDAMVLAVFLRRQLYFYVRGDIFNHPLAYKILTILHMIPIYSQEHGTGILERNKRTFDRGRELLQSGKMLLIFPEGFSRQSKQLETFKKGAARVALQTAFGDGFHGDLLIQTVAINYTFHNRGAHLFIRVGENMMLEPYREAYLTFPAQAVNRLTAEMERLFAQNVIHVAKGVDTDHAEFLISMLYHQPDFNPEHFFDQAQTICQTLGSMDESSYREKRDILTNYRFRLMKYPLDDFSLSQPVLASREKTMLIILFPIFLIGAVLGAVPLMVSRWIAVKTVTRIDFHTSVYSGVMGVLGLIWWVLILTIAGVLGGMPWLIVALLTPFYFLGAWQWWKLRERSSAARRFNQYNNQDPQFVRGLLQVRQQLILE
jgi:1-acyl-sn-glycerol-3-phosphate acyltransferase